MAVQQNLVLFLELESRMRHAMSQIAIIGKQQQSGRWAIEPANRDDALADIHKIEDRASASLILGRRNVARWLVEHQVAFWLHTDNPAIHLDLLVVRVYPETFGLDDLAIDLYPAFGNHLLGFSSGCDTTCRQYFVQAFHFRSFPRQNQAQVLVHTDARS